MAAVQNDARTTSVYEVLDSNTLEFRLLHLKPNTEWTSPIHCQLQKISLSNLESINTYSPFEALSYTWGDLSGEGQTILVNGQYFPVTTNLAAFLRQRRQLHSTVTLWVDAICINQADNKEKNHQVGMMRMIYMAAAGLTIWLGTASEDSQLAMQEVRRLGSASPYHKMPLLGEAKTRQMQRLFQRPWWSRVWIVQELVLGGAGTKMERIQVQCGTEVLPWKTLVIAAARFKAHEVDQREVFPNVRTILELDSLRESVGYHMTSPAYSTHAFDLLCRFRHFAATNPRDKIYALYDIFAIPGKQKMPLHYEAEVHDVYLDFATNMISSGVGLELLRHCGPTRFSVPSWVPDWSTQLLCDPLPIRRIPRYFDVPWWSEPVETDKEVAQSWAPELSHSTVSYRMPGRPRNPITAQNQRNIRLNRLAVGASGYGVVNCLEEIPYGFSFHRIDKETKSRLEELLQTHSIILSVQDERCLKRLPDQSRDEPAHPLRQGEILTERRTKSWIVRELDHLNSSPMIVPPQQPGQTKPSFQVTGSMLSLEGVMWDTIETCHDGFVHDVTQHWSNATTFMVAVGCCKKLAVDCKSAQQRHGSMEKLLESFWLTLFAGQITHFDTSYDVKQKNDRMRYVDWLPEVPHTWKMTNPRPCVSSTGHIRMAEHTHHAREACKTLETQHPKSSGNFRANPLLRFADLIPENYTEDEKMHLEADCRHLATLWQSQPYDLYHRPFELPHIVPDPYWESRRQTDHEALRLMQEVDYPFIVGLGSPSAVDSYEYKFISDDTERRWRSVPSMLPPGTLDPRMEQYALGRKFFSSKKGYSGLGPTATKPGDQVIVVQGSQVPFVIRETPTKGSRPTWRLIGECYVHGVMNDEVMAQVEIGTVSTETIVLI